MRKIYIIFENESNDLVKEKLTEYNADLVRLSCVWFDKVNLKNGEIIYPIVRKYEEPKFPEADLLILINVFSLKECYIKDIPHKKLLVIQTKDNHKLSSNNPEIIKQRRLEFRGE